MLEVYREVAEDVLAIPVFKGRKTAAERFPGAVETYCIEGLMRDGKALQCGTSHFLGQNFAKAYDVTFLNADGEQEHAWATSWGFTTRMVGGTIMAHGDDAGLRLPPAVAPIQVVIVPIYRSDEERASVIERRGAAARRPGRAGRPGAARRPRPASARLQVRRVGAQGRADADRARPARRRRRPGGDRQPPRRRQGGGRRSTRWPPGMAERLASVQRPCSPMRSPTERRTRTRSPRSTPSPPASRSRAASGSRRLVRRWDVRGGDQRRRRRPRSASCRSSRPIRARACMHCGKPGVDVATWARAY